MRSTYLAIFEAYPDSIAWLRETLARTPTPEERAEMDRIAGEALINPEKVSPEDYEKIFKEDGKTQVAKFFETELVPAIDKFLEEYPDKEDIPWSVFKVMIADDFFSELNPDTNLDFDSRYNIYLLPEAIVLPDLSWTKDKHEEVMSKYKHGYVYVFFTIDI